MLFIGLPSHNEATTVGVLLWRLRTVLAEVSREYEVIVYDDASTDGTADVLAPYARVLPLTLLRGERRLGTAGAMDAIVRHVVRTTRYPRRDGLLFMQADFTDAPTIVPEFLRRFEGGADLIIGERRTPGDAPQSVRRLMTASRWVLRPFVGISDVRDLTTSFRLARVAVLRDLLKATNDAPVCSGEGWAAQAEFLLNAAPHARRIETIPVTPSFAVRTRETRRQAWPDTVALLRWAWQHRGLRIAAKVIARDVETANEPTEVAEAIEEDRLARAERAEARRESGARDAGPRGETGGRRRERTRDGGRAARRGEDGEERRGARASDETPRAPRSDEAVARAGRGDDEGRRRSRKERTPRARAARGEAPIGPDGVAASALEGAEAGTAPARADRSEPVAPDGVTADASGGAETEEGRRRRRRRSRRSRGGGTGEERLDAEPLADGAGAADGLSSAPDQGRGAEMREPGVARDDDADDASDEGSEGSEGSEGTRRRRRARRGRRRGRGDGDVTDASGSAEAGGGDETDRDVADRDDTADGTDEGGRAEARRRRGRRGRRGGRRRAGSEGGDGGGEATGGADGEPGGAPSADRGDQ